MIFCIMQRLLTKDVAMQYSLLGRKGKKIFCHLRMYAAVIGKLYFSYLLGNSFLVL